MNKQTLATIGAMLNSFPQGAANPDLLLRSYETSLNGMADDVIMEIGRRYMAGAVDGQSLTFAPSVAEFTTACRKLVEARLAKRALPHRLDALAHEPIEVRKNRMRKQFDGRAVLATDLTHEKWLAGFREYPFGSEYSALLETVFGPAPLPDTHRSHSPG